MFRAERDNKTGPEHTASRQQSGPLCEWDWQASAAAQILYMRPRIAMRVPPVSGHMVPSTSCTFP